MKKMVVVSLSIMVILIVVINVLAQVMPPTGTAGLPRIFYTEAFEQEEGVYFVYFWRNNCSRCAEFEPYVVEAFNEGVPIYVVDMNHRRNQEAWYGNGAYRDEDFAERAAEMFSASHYSAIDIEGTPTVIKIGDGVVTAQAAGVSPSVQLLNTY